MSNYGNGRPTRTPKMVTPPGRRRTAPPRTGPTPPTLPNGKTPGGPKGLPPGLGGAARGQGTPGGPPERTAVVAQLRSRFGKRKVGPRD